MMLPHLPRMKMAIFTRRIILFHETFAPLGGTKNNQNKPIGVIWHEGITGRNNVDLASTYIGIINDIDYRDYDHFVFWVDNCATQNKNLTLCSTLLYIVNQRTYWQSVIISILRKAILSWQPMHFTHPSKTGCMTKSLCMISSTFKIS